MGIPTGVSRVWHVRLLGAFLQGGIKLSGGEAESSYTLVQYTVCRSGGWPSDLM